ncbi:hypothetical protein [Legionella clemsonensis]|uniref:Uncharacterized protein n=1 Tax=Legionella clemsonensis TaxID=1867846 RepID=A0A222NYR5_9GAMM|nr:hypothetical protein [Legionella clemsonensis]ASQ44733.1 hypothetical protein clem_00835 [Legionella clemsonensis]
MKKSSSSTSRKQTKPKVRKEYLKNISGGRGRGVFIPEDLPDPDEIRRIVDEHFKRQ